MITLWKVINHRVHVNDTDLHDGREAICISMLFPCVFLLCFVLGVIIFTIVGIYRPIRSNLCNMKRATSCSYCEGIKRCGCELRRTIHHSMKRSQQTLGNPQGPTMLVAGTDTCFWKGRIQATVNYTCTNKHCTCVPDVFPLFMKISPPPPPPQKKKKKIIVLIYRVALRPSHSSQIHVPLTSRVYGYGRIMHISRAWCRPGKHFLTIHYTCRSS